jgi:hypothetical protein
MIDILENVAKFDQAVAENVLWMFDDAEEIGSSDINACVNNILREFYKDVKEAPVYQFSMVKIAVRQALFNMEDIRNLY